MVTVPGDTPVTTPVAAPTVPIAVAVLVHVPPAVPSASVVVDPMHTPSDPVIFAGSGFTVTAALTKHPVGKV